jgi:YD repeat-containing protein
LDDPPVRSFTDAEYYAANRVTKTTYPDGTFESYAYDKLDLATVLGAIRKAMPQTKLAGRSNER